MTLRKTKKSLRKNTNLKREKPILIKNTSLRTKKKENLMGKSHSEGVKCKYEEKHKPHEKSLRKKCKYQS